MAIPTRHILSCSCIVGILFSDCACRHESENNAPANTSCRAARPTRPTGARSHYRNADKAPAVCGQSALYVLMRLHGYSVPYCEVMQRVSSVSMAAPSRGTSILQLTTAAVGLGFPCEARKYSNRRLESVGARAYPFLAHCRQGHYVVVVDLDSNGVYLIDGTSGAGAKIPTQAFTKEWSGYAVVARDRSIYRTGAGAALLFLGVWLLRRWRSESSLRTGGQDPQRSVAMCLLASLIRGRRGKLAADERPVAPSRFSTQRPRIRGVLAMSVAFCASGFNSPRLAACAPQAARLQPPSVWRAPERDGINCLYVLSHIARRDLAYEGLVSATRGRRSARMDIAEVRDIAGGVGLPLTISRRSPHELTDEILPVIAHGDNPEVGYGTFVILIARSGSYWLLIRGDTVGIEKVSMDDFRRNWSGFVLERRRPSFRTAAMRSLGIGLLAVGTSIILRFVRRPARQIEAYT